MYRYSAQNCSNNITVDLFPALDEEGVEVRNGMGLR